MLRGVIKDKGPTLLLVLSSMAIYVSSLRPSFKYLDSLIPAVAFIVLMIALVINSHRLLSIGWVDKLVSSPITWYSAIGALGFLTVFFYPLADGLKSQMGGWDQDDCLILGVENLVQGSNPYQDRSYFGNPCSPGFGALALYLPFIVLGLIPVAPIAWILSGQILVKLVTQDGLRAGLFLALIASSPMTLELLVNGSDIVVMGFGLLISGLLLEWALNRGKIFHLVALGGLIGLIASMRVNFLLLLGVAGIYALIRIGAKGLWFVATSGLVAVVPSLVIYLSEPTIFTPLHLVGKSQALVPFPLYVLMALMTLAALGLGALFVRSRRINLVEYLSLVFAPHIVFLAFSPLVFGGWDFFNWEAAHYLYVLTPLLAFIASREITVRLKNL